jgi:HSP20 family molecular chaperone IbpA
MTPSYNDPPFVPHLDLLISNSGDLVMKADLSGLRSGDIEIAVEENRVRIKGRRRDSDSDHARMLLIKEIPVGPFEGVVEFPRGFALSAAKATYLNGVLCITVPPAR